MASITTTMVSFASAGTAPQIVPPPRDVPVAPPQTTPQQLAQVSQIAAERNALKGAESRKRDIPDPHARAEGSFAPKEEEENEEQSRVQKEPRRKSKQTRQGLDLEV